mmetsp:Transcript_48807/g.95402  ORF Transcript_48807/g.95402 Transcript_48807/m.95402 type:complete len:516 (+) Transcript_48807:294-1841(+)
METMEAATASHGDRAASWAPDSPSYLQAVAEVTEVCCHIATVLPPPYHVVSSSRIASILQLYPSYQRNVLRQRVRPPLALLADARAAHRRGPVRPIELHHHVEALTTVLSEASVLLAPLREWSDGAVSAGGDAGAFVPAVHALCAAATAAVDEEAQVLAGAVCRWFTADGDLKTWAKAAGQARGGEGRGGDRDAGDLDRLLADLAFVCQLCARYCQFVGRRPLPCPGGHGWVPPPLPVLGPSRSPPVSGNAATTLFQYLAEHGGYYAVLEAHSLRLSVRSAAARSLPVEILDGVCAPSVVEDAFALSRDAVRRCASTLNRVALGVVGMAIADVWSCDGGREDRGPESVCSVLERNKDLGTNQSSNYPQSDATDSITTSAPKPKKPDAMKTFASAFLSALDGDMFHEPVRNAQTLDGASRSAVAAAASDYAPVLFEHEAEALRSSLCALNGIANAAAACAALACAISRLGTDRLRSTSDFPCRERRDRALPYTVRRPCLSLPPPTLSTDVSASDSR